MISKNGFIAQCEQQIEVYNSFITALHRLTEIAPQWNNKVMTKRFISALNNDERIKSTSVSFGLGDLKYSYQLKQNTMELTFFCSNMCKSYKDGNGKFTNWTYAPEDNGTLYMDYTANVPYIGEDKRLNTDELIKAVNKHITNLQKKINTYQDTIDNLDAYIEKIEKLNEEIIKVKNEIPHIMVGYYSTFNLPFYNK